MFKKWLKLDVTDPWEKSLMNSWENSWAKLFTAIESPAVSGVYTKGTNYKFLDLVLYAHFSYYM